MVKAVIKIELAEPKAKVSRRILDKLNIEGKALVVVDIMSDTVKLSFRNLKGVSLMEGRNLNARDVLLNDNIVIEKEAFEKLTERLR
jgi:large subunit ribosomal protein L4